MKRTPVPQNLPRRSLALTAAALGIALLAIPFTAAAQDAGSQKPGVQQPAAQETDSATPRVPRGVERFIRLYDLDGDGKVSVKEINDDQARMFTALDIDNNKQMSVEEIRRRGRSLQVFRTTTLFDLLDTNGDGQLSLVEVQAPSQRWFKRYDQNGDGVMEATEIPPQRSWGRGGRR